jgi:galactokinase
MKSFADIFGNQPEATADAPGRVNLLGEHTDYSDGFVLPTAIPQRTRVAMRRNGRSEFTLYAADLDQTARFTQTTAPAEHFARYVYGCLREVQKRGVAVPPLDIHVSSDVPMGVGLSSSAALEVSVLRALCDLLDLQLDPVEIARLAQHAEIEYAGVQCGIMDQMASSLADTGRMLFLDTRTLERRVLPLPQGAEIVVVDSGISRTLAGSRYNERRAECEEAARRLGVPALRDLSDLAAIERLDEPYRRRARHVVTENRRVLRAVEGVRAAEFGALMNASHQSLRDDYEVSIAALDELVAALQGAAGSFGAKLTGAGFGGACVALCELGRGRELAQQVIGQYNRRGRELDRNEGRVLVPVPA